MACVCVRVRVHIWAYSHFPTTPHFLACSDIFQIKEGLVYTAVLTCVVGVADITTLFCCWETNKPGGATVHHSV